MSFRKSAPCWGLLALAAAACGQTTPLTLDDCVRLAQSAHSAVSIAREQAEIARYGITQARAGFLPQANIGNVYAYNSPLQNGQFSYVALNGIHEYSSLANVGMEIDTSGRLRAQMARAHADQDAANASVALSQRDLKRAVTGSYYRVLLARRLMRVAEETLAEARAFENRTRLLFEHGEAAKADVVKAEAESAMLMQTLKAADLDAQIANHELASYWTTDVDTPLTLVELLDEPPPLPETPAPGAPFLRRMEFQVFDAQRRGFQADARRARADLLPQLSFVQQYGLDSLHYSFADRGYASFVQLNIPVFDWFKARSAAKQSELQARQVDTSRHVAERAFSREYRDALSRVQLIYDQIALSESQVRLSEDNLRLSRVRYEGGEGSALDVVSAQSQVAQARTNYYTAKANYLNARADLEVAQGQ